MYWNSLSWRRETAGKLSIGSFMSGANTTCGYRVIAQGLRSPEGPVVLPDGSYAVVESMASRLTRVAPDGEKTELAFTGGGPNGLALDRRGRLLVANNGGMGHPVKNPGSLQRREADGEVVALAAGLDAPNDVCIGSDGAVWFTDPRDTWYAQTLRPGRIYRWNDDLTVMHEGLDYPNGIGVDASGRIVVAESRSGWLHILTDGVTERWARCPTGAPDGFCFDVEGRCFVCCFDVHSIFVIEPDGRTSDVLRIETQTAPTNCAISPDGSLIVTESMQGRLLALDLGLRPLLESAS